MKILFLKTAILLSLSAYAQPINYQGKLSDKSGSPVNGTKNFSLKIFDDKTGGKQIYEEAIGQTAVKDGLYSFNFGEAGKSVSTATETIGFADGEKQIFNYTVKNKPVLGEIKISGSGYSWTEAGSSDASKFTATANKNSGAISAIYLTGPPEAGGQISISYTHGTDGITGALSRGGQAWLELTVDGEALSPRERLVAVPFALRADFAKSLSNDILVPIHTETPHPTFGRIAEVKFGPGTERDRVTNPSSSRLAIRFRVPTCKKIMLNIETDEITVYNAQQNTVVSRSDKEMQFEVSLANFEKGEEISQADKQMFVKSSRKNFYEINSPKPGFYGLEIWGLKQFELPHQTRIRSLIVYAVY